MNSIIHFLNFIQKSIQKPSNNPIKTIRTLSQRTNVSFFSAHLWYILDFSPSSCGLAYEQNECIFYVDKIYTGTSRNIFYLNNMNTISIYIYELHCRNMNCTHNILYYYI